MTKNAIATTVEELVDNSDAKIISLGNASTGNSQAGK